MKKMTFIVCAAMLASAVLFTGCKKDENAPEQKAPSVKTDIAISLPGVVAGNAKKMPGQKVQDGTTGDAPSVAADFAANGISDIILIPYAKSAEVIGTSKRLSSGPIDLGSIAPAISFDVDVNGRARLFPDQSMPIGTSAFLFYAVSGAPSTSKAERFQAGYLNASYDAATPASHEFYLQPVLDNVSDVTSNEAYVGLLAFLNYLANTEAGTPAKAWKNYSDVAPSTDHPGLTETFANFATVHTLNSYNVERMLNDLYKSLNTLATVEADPMAIALRAKMTDGTYASLVSEKVTLNAALQGFPANVNMPEGAIQVAYNAAPDVKAFESSAAWTMTGRNAAATMSVASLDRYVFPAQLWYYANTRIKTSEESEAEHYVATADNWDAILAEYSKDNGSVTTKTRSIALKKVAQYAVGRLDVRLRAAETLTDNNPIAGSRNIVNTTGYKLTGVLIGNQKNVGFDFTPATHPETGGHGHGVSYTIYDKEITRPSVVPGTAAFSDVINSTLVLETEANEPVTFAIELLNNSGKDFYGVDGIVPAGGKFYLVGQMLGTEATETDGKVFAQDRITTAKLNINSLEKAYCTIPDLKTPQLEIGLSVDLEWRTGHEYTVEL